MNTVILVFMCISMVLSLYSTMIITHDILSEHREKRLEKSVEISKPVIQPETESKEALATIVAETAVTSESEGVRFSQNVPTLEEKYLALKPEYKGYYNEIVKYAAQMEESKRYKNARYEEYKLGKTRLVRLLIKRGVVHAELILQNSSFKTYVAENKISVKAAATVIKVVDAATVKAVKDAIDISVKTMHEVREERKRIANEKRKEKRRQSK